MKALEINDFVNTVCDAYAQQELSVLLLNSNRNFADYVPPNMPFRAQVMELVTVANREGWISELVQGVIAERPKNELVREFLSKYPNWDPANH